MAERRAAQYRWLGPSSDFGWARCHGCERMQDDWGDIEHKPDCPRICARKDCEDHERSG